MSRPRLFSFDEKMTDDESLENEVMKREPISLCTKREKRIH